MKLEIRNLKLEIQLTTKMQTDESSNEAKQATRS